MRLPAQLLHRRINSNKSDFGHVFILAGSLKYSGAALLCAEAAMRAGCGLVTLGVCQSIAHAFIKIKAKEVMLLPLPGTKQGNLSSIGFKKIKDFAKNCEVFVIGPGIGTQETTQVLARRLIAAIDKPMVIDADGLNALVGNLDILRKPRNENREPVLTPHPGEMAKLLGISVDRVQSKRKEIAKKFARDFKVTLVLKGYQTIVADQKGNLYINRTGNPGMATAGTGDVLAGIIGAFLGQGLNAFQAAKYAVYLHGLAADLAEKEKTQISLIASDMIAKIPDAIKKCN
jgi:hydroxyethylthiazole kinase-like uncharacterized protein yjeF